MAKRIKKKIGSGRSALKLESLEQRQLLATIVAGSGTEVGSNIKGANGNTFDQILLTGASVSVKADAGEIVRISFLDNSGDIVQTEYSGGGTISVSLEDLKTVGSPGYVNNNPVQTLNGKTVDYVQGLASILISNPDVTSNVGIFSAGAITNPGLFAGQAKQGGNNVADIARLVIVGDPTNAAGYSNFGGIRAGNTTFSADSGVVGIRAENIAVQQIVAIGDIDAKGSGVPTLMFNTNSQFQTVFVRGGDLVQTNGASFDSFGNGSGGAPGGSPGNGNNISLGGFSYFNSTDGTTSAGKLQWATPVNQSAIRLATVDQQTLVSGDWVFDWTNPSKVVVTQGGIDVSATFGGDWLAKGGVQTSLDWAFERKSFTGNITISGDLPQNIELNLADAKNITFNNNLLGLLTVNGFGASIDTLTVKGNLDGAVLVNGLDRTSIGSGLDGQVNSIGALIVNGDAKEFTEVRAESIGNVTINGSFSGIISTNVNQFNNSTTNNTWNGTARTGTGYVDFEGAIGNVLIGYKADGTSSGGSIKNGTIQGMTGIGNVKVGGDVWGSSPGTAVFVTSSNPGAAPTDVRNYGSANIGTIDVKGDVDLDSSSQRFIHIAGNGTYGNINVQGITTTNTVPGVQTGSHVELIPGSDTYVRILSPFTDVGFKIDASKGQKLVGNFDPDGVAGPLNDTYYVTAADVTAKAQIYTINIDGTLGPIVAAKVGDRVPYVVNGVAQKDQFGATVYVQNTALYQGQTQVVPDFGPSVTTIVSGNRGNLDGVYNNFGRIEIAGLLGAQQSTTGTLNWSDSVDMNFGGVTLNSSGGNNANVIGQVGTIGTITINNTSGKTSDLALTGVIGSPNGSSSGTNSGTAFAGLAGLTIGGFEDVRFASISGNFNNNNIIHATNVGTGISITTVAGSGDGTVSVNGGPLPVSPSVLFDSVIRLDNGTVEAGQKALLTINTGTVNSTVRFSGTDGESGIVVDDGANTGQGSQIGGINITADTIAFAGRLIGRSIEAITFTGGKGIGSSTDTAVSFTGRITTDNFAGFTGTATQGNVSFAPTSIVPSSGSVPGVGGLTKAVVGPILLSTSGTNNGGDITLGNGAAYLADFGDITLSAGHKLHLSEAGTVIDNPGNITINFATGAYGNIGNLSATTTTGNINNALVVQGNAGNISYKAGAATVSAADALTYGGSPGDLARAGSIDATQTIWGTRGVTTMEVAGQKADGTADTLNFTVKNSLGVDVAYSILPSGTIGATLNYAGASTAAGDAFIAKSGSGGVTVNYNIVGNDDNVDGVLAISEIGHGGNVSVSSVSGDIAFTGGTRLTDYTHVATLGNVALKTGSHPQASGFIGGTEKGDILISFNSQAAGALGVIAVGNTGGFEGAIGNVTANTTAGDITINQSRLDGKAGNFTLTTGAVAHTGGVMAGNIATGGTGLTFNAGHGVVTATTTDVGTLGGTFSDNGPRTATGNGYVFTSQYGAIDVTVGAGRYDTNNNGLFTAEEYGNTGDLSLTSSGAPISLTLNSNQYASPNEQSSVGNVTILNAAYIDVRNGATDQLGTGKTALGSAITGANGAITITGAASNIGIVGNIKADTNVGTITHTGRFGDLGTVTLSTTSYTDTDTVPNSPGIPDTAALLWSGNVAIGSGAGPAALHVNGKHGLATYKTTEDGTITGTAYYGGAQTGADGVKADSNRGTIALNLWLEDIDRDGNGAIGAVEFGKLGTIKLATGTTGVKSGGGDITLNLGTDQNNAAVLARNLVPEFTFGAITATVGDNYTSTSATAADVVSASLGDITITGVGADATTHGTIALPVAPAAGFGPVTGNRGTIESITANVIRGTATLNGQFGAVGDQNLTATRHQDVLTAANTAVIVGSVAYSPSIWGTHGLATLRIDDSGTAGSGTITTGTISGTAIFGGAATKATSVDAKSGRGDINLDIFSRGFDINGDGIITDGATNNVPGDQEFARVGNLLAETTNAGDVLLGVAIATANGSTVGSKIGNVTVIANDDLYSTVTANALDTGNLAVATVVGKSAIPITAGTVGDISITTNTGTAGLRGNFFDIGAVSIVTGTYNDASGPGGTPAVIAGNIALGNQAWGPATVADTAGHTSLNIAGKYNDSSLKVIEGGTISGAVYVAGAGGKNWTLESATGTINVGFIAGFDADGAGGVGSGEAGTIGNIAAKSATGVVTIGVGGRQSGSVIGTVSVESGDKVTQVAAAADTIIAGNVIVTGISGGGLGTVGNITGKVAAGTATLNGTFGNIGNVTYTTDAVIDTDPTATALENSSLWQAGDIALAAAVWGTHGTLNLTTYDSSKVAAINSVIALVAPQTTVPTLNQVAGAVADLGNITGNISFSGGLNSGVTDGIIAKSDRGTINLLITSGINEDGDAVQDGNEAGSAGNIAFTSTDGNLTANVNVRNSSSSIGSVTLNTGDTYAKREEAADVSIASGTATVTSSNAQDAGPVNNPNNQNYGTVGNVVVNTTTGNITFGGTYQNLGTVTLTGGRKTDTDTLAGSGEPTAVLAAADITVNTTVRGNHNTFTLTTVDDSTAGAAVVADPGVISSTITVTGALQTGTNTLVASSQQAGITSTLTAGTYAKIVDGIANITADNAATNTDDFVGVAGNVSLTSVFGSITSTNNTSAIAKAVAGDSIRYTKIGSVTASTGTSRSILGPNVNDTVLAGLDGGITFAGGSAGEIGAITGTTTAGDISFGGTYNNVVGAITLTAGTYTDNSPLTAGVDILDAGSITLGGTFASTANTTVGAINLTTGGVVSNIGDIAGDITVTADVKGAWSDTVVVNGKVDPTTALGALTPSELITFTSGAINATVVDGLITFNLISDATGYGAKLAGVSLKSTGSSTLANTGNISVGGAGGSFSEVSNFLAEATTGNVEFAAAYLSPTISNVTLHSKDGNGVTPAGLVTFSGGLNLGLQASTDNRTKNVSTTNVSIKSDNGNVTFSGTIGESINYGVGNVAVITTTDNRTATITGVSVLASNGAANDGAADGSVTITGSIGSNDITTLTGVVFTAGVNATDATTVPAGGIRAHDIGTIAFTGNVALTGAAAILASDADTTRQYIGTVDYTNMVTGTTANKGSLLDTIDSITVTNGSTTGSAGVTYFGTNRGEIEASYIGQLSLINSVNPSVGPAYAVSNLDVVASNSRGGASQGEFLNVLGVSANDAAHAITKFGLGNVEIAFNVTNTDNAGGLFLGDSAFIGLGGIGQNTSGVLTGGIKLTTSTAGSVPRPMFSANPGDGVRFAAGVGIAYGATFDLDGDIGTAAAAYNDVAVAGVGDKISVGDIYVKVGRSLPANPVDPLMLNIGGGNADLTDGFGVLVAAQTPTAGNLATAVDATRQEIYGYIRSVDVSTTSTRDDANATAFAVVGGAAVPAGGGADGAFIAVAGDFIAGGTAIDIGNLDNDFTPNGDAPVNDGDALEGHILGDTDAMYEEGEVLVYVL